jgi:HKD family nuclease
MKIINTTADLGRQLIRLIRQYPKIAIATAWASADTDVFKALIQNEGRIVCAVIGTHFYQTHPDVLDRFVGSTKVKFMLQPNGVFHPKVYLFWGSDAWEVIVGSPNLTVGALTKNSEVSVLIGSDDGQLRLKQELIELIHEYAGRAVTIKKRDAENYRKLWRMKARELKKVADIFGEKPATKPAIQSKVLTMDWPAYLAEVKKDRAHGFEKRLALLKEISGHFKKHAHFNDMPLAVRKGIAGLPNTAIKNWGWFGSMKGAMTYGGLINKGHKAFSLALDKIPLSGKVTKDHYDAYIAEYLKAYPNGRDGLATATRLLAMKRPDTFLCVDAQNLKKLAKDVGLVKAGLDYERYWNEIVLRLSDSPWWKSEEPFSPPAKAAWNARAAMLDSIFYEEKKSKSA